MSELNYAKRCSVVAGDRGLEVHRHGAGPFFPVGVHGHLSDGHYRDNHESSLPLRPTDTHRRKALGNSKVLDKM